MDDAKGLSGLYNMGNTCYLNAALQCLSNTQSLTEFFLKEEYRANRNKKEYKICDEYCRVLNGLWEDNCVVKPVSFKKVLESLDNKFANRDQHDSQEVLFTLIDLFHTALSYEVNITYEGVIKNELDKKMVESINVWGKYFKKEYSKILDIFFGQFYSRVICKKCNYSSNNFDPFSMITLQVLQKNSTIYNCFDDFVKYETLDCDDGWKCEHCGKNSNPVKNIQIWRAPDTLIIVLKRFDYNNFSSKNNNIVDFPLSNLNLEKYVSGYDKYEAVYDLYGIIYHHGDMNIGHYVSACKNINNKWYLYDDDTVSTYNKVEKSNAYVLFYKKKD